MSTKFVSKNSNLMIVLRPGLEGNRALGTQPQPGLYVRFQGGTVDIKEDSVVELLRNHPSYNTDFLEVKEEEADPYEYNRDEIEPAHVLTEMKYGHAEKTVGTPRKNKMSPEVKKMIENEAMKMIPDLLKANPGMLKDIILSMAADIKAEDEPLREASAYVSEEETAVEPVVESKKKAKK